MRGIELGLGKGKLIDIVKDNNDMEKEHLVLFPFTTLVDVLIELD